MIYVAFTLYRSVFCFFGYTSAEQKPTYYRDQQYIIVDTSTMTYDDDSSVEVFEEDPNVPTGVNCLGDSKLNDVDNSSIASELSDQTMKRCGLTYDCKPDISEVANLTLDVNYGDLANMACDRRLTSQSSLGLGLAHSTVEDCGELTWSQLLDDSLQQSPSGVQNDKMMFIWNQGYDEAPSLAGAALAPSFTSSRPPFKSTRRPSDMSVASLSSLTSRPKPLHALKRFIARRKLNKMNNNKQSSSSTADTAKSSYRGWDNNTTEGIPAAH